MVALGPMVQQLVDMVWQLPISKQWSHDDNDAVSKFLDIFLEQHAHHSRRQCYEWLEYCLNHPKSISFDKAQYTESVNIMTLHAAKGLEFPMVIVPFIDSAFNMGATDPMIVSNMYGLGVSIPKKSKENKVRKCIFNYGTTTKDHSFSRS